MSEALALPPEASAKLTLWHAARARVVFTNGVFDLLHRGHAEYLEEARALGDRLVVGVNTDASVRRLKGPSRPIVGREFEESHGGRVTTIPHREGLSTSEIVKRIREGKGV